VWIPATIVPLSAIMPPAEQETPRFSKCWNIRPACFDVLTQNLYQWCTGSHAVCQTVVYRKKTRKKVRTLP